MGLNDPTVKMSKTHSSARGHAVAMLDEPKEIERSFKRAVTDSGGEIAFSDDPARAGVNNLLGIYKVVTGKSKDDVERDFTDARGYGDLKMRVAEVVIEELRPIQQRYYRLMDDLSELDALMARGAEQARPSAAPSSRRQRSASASCSPELPPHERGWRDSLVPPDVGGSPPHGWPGQPGPGLPRDYRRSRHPRVGLPEGRQAPVLLPTRERGRRRTPSPATALSAPTPTTSSGRVREKATAPPTP